MPSYPMTVENTGGELSPDFLETVESFYGARNIKEAEVIVAEAAGLAPDAAQTHEIAGHLARLKGDVEQAWRHYYFALATPGNGAALLNLHDLLSVSMTATQYRETLALFEDLYRTHTNPELRRVAAAFAASWQRRLNRDATKAEDALETRGDPVQFAIISAFDNEEGQGFTVEYLPEREIDFDKEYTGTQLPARWRTEVPLDHQHNLSFSDLVSPGLNVVAYAVTYVSVPKKGEYALQVTTADALKLWVNDIQLLSEQRVEGDAVDQFRIPVVLRKGWNKLLIKSCHEQGSWLLGLSVTDPDGAKIPELVTSVGPKEVNDGPPPGDEYRLDKDLDRRLSNIKGSLRRKYYAIQTANNVGLLNAAQNLADEYSTAAPSGLLARLELALIAWNAGQLGATIDILDVLIKENGDKAPWLYVLRADYFSQQERADRARDDLLYAIEANPDYRLARNRLAYNYAEQGWAENHLEVRIADAARWPDDTETLWGLADAYRKLGRRPEAGQVYRDILSFWKGASDILKKMAELSLIESDYSEAIRYQETLIELFPNTPNYHLRLGDILRRAGRLEDATHEYQRCRELDGRWSTPVKRLGALAFERGDVDEAVSLWKESLALDPDNHSLADRLEYIAPEEDGLFDSYVPDSDAIKKALSKRDSVRVHPGADTVFLLDHAVGQVEMDGSIRQVVTQIIMAVNDTGRDSITKHSLPFGRLRVKEAYAIDPDGARYEASSVRGNSVRFRDLKVGSAVVIQYRLDEYPGGYLSRHLYRRWFFHGPSSQFEDSHYVLLVPKEMKLKEHGYGKWKRQETARDDRRILEYRATQVPPLVLEPFSPPIIELLEQVVISSIPDWGVIAGWDAALLVNAFRTTPKLKDVAVSLTKGASTKQEKLDAITRFVMREIRYQQDYESTIAGVKPHAAPVVLQRAYGDCKDKSVLLMTLAKEVGIETRFALLRTTGEGQFIKDLPSFQFNHAIVYVPPQEGLEGGFFLDATPDTLDLKTLRPDSQNTWALVISPETEKWEFVHIPLMSAEMQYTLRRIRIAPKVGGESTIEIALTFQGPAAAALRAVLRNKDDTRVLTAQLATNLFPRSRVKNVSFAGDDDVVMPLTMNLTLVSEGLTRQQGDDVVIELPRSENLSKFTSLAERRLPLQTSLFLSLVETEEEVTIPEGYTKRHVPEEIEVDNQFFTFTRKTEEEGQKIRLKMRYVEKKQRISVEEYSEFREAVSQIIENLSQDLVLTPLEVKKKGKKKRGKKKSGKS
ncbi:MAG: DUF3857 domain-containing protein [Deltaproteobacteria bacterium]|nr:DUF3857 domain-containing protein [Deltaproteobacteria bacterium]